MNAFTVVVYFSYPPPYFDPANKVAPTKQFPWGTPPTIRCQTTGGVTKVHNHGNPNVYVSKKNRDRTTHQPKDIFQKT